MAGAWHAVTRAELYVGGQWRTVKRGEAYKAADWRTILSFVPTMSVSANDVFGSGATLQITSDPSTATPVGGVAPFTYTWSVVSGSAVALTPNSATTAFRAFLAPTATDNSTAEVLATDALGATATATIQITLSRDGGGGGVDP